MTQEEFNALVKKLETYAQKKPNEYIFRVKCLALLGYGYIFLILVALLVVITILGLFVFYSNRISGGMIKLMILLLVPIGIILRSLWFKIPPPEGLELDLQTFPQLSALIEEITQALEAPKFHHVLLTSEFNASVAQVPRFGLLGWPEDYLILGLPLMQALSPEQFRAVLAHEVGHLSGNHSQFAGWVYRVRKTWGQIQERFEQSGQPGVDSLFSAFLNWYVPYFNAYTFVLARANEYDADRCAAEVAGRQHMAEALLNLEIKAQVLNQSFWNKVYQQADEQPDPPKSVYAALGKTFEAGEEPESEQRWLQQALRTQTNNLDTHPCLTDRLKALDYAQTVTVPKPTKVTAAKQFLGTALPELIAALDQEWQTAVNYQWRERYTQTQELRATLQALEEKASSSSLTAEETWNRIQWTIKLKGDHTAIPLLHSLLEEQPDHVGGNYVLGEILLQQGDEAGIQYLETAMAKSMNLVLDGCQLIYSFLQRQGREEEAAIYYQRGQKHYEQLVLARQERSDVWDNDRFEAHGLSAAEEAEIRRQLTAYQEVKEAYLVRKVVQYFPQEPFYVLAIIYNQSLFEMNLQAAQEKLLDRLANELQFPGQAWIMVLNNRPQKLKNAIRKAAVTAIFQR